jgi:predicted metal-binding protein
VLLSAGFSVSNVATTEGRARVTTTWITICDTCKREDWIARGMEQTDGERLAGLIESAAQGTGLAVRRTACLMGCDHSCNVAIQAEGKLAYTLGRFEPSEEAAEGIVAYAAGHAASATGQVPYREWPQAVKGHFITRHPPLPGAEDAA